MTGNRSGNQRCGKSSKQGQYKGTQETALVVDNYMCIRTISNKACHCLADLWKIETNSTYQYPIYLLSENFMQKTLILLSSRKEFSSATSGNSPRLLIYRGKEF